MGLPRELNPPENSRPRAERAPISRGSEPVTPEIAMKLSIRCAALVALSAAGILVLERARASVHSFLGIYQVVLATSLPWPELGVGATPNERTFMVPDVQNGPRTFVDTYVNDLNGPFGPQWQAFYGTWAKKGGKYVADVGLGFNQAVGEDCPMQAASMKYKALRLAEDAGVVTIRGKLVAKMLTAQGGRTVKTKYTGSVFGTRTFASEEN